MYIGTSNSYELERQQVVSYSRCTHFLCLQRITQLLCPCSRQNLQLLPTMLQLSIQILNGAGSEVVRRHQLLGRLVHRLDIPIVVRNLIQVGLVLLLQVLYAHERFAVVRGFHQWSVLFDPLYFFLHVSRELLQFERVFKLLFSLGSGAGQLGESAGCQLYMHTQ